MKTARLWPAGMVLAALAWMALGTGRSGAGDDDDKETRDALLKIAAAIKAGDDAGAKKQAVALAKKIDTVEEVMDLLKPRKKDKKGKYVGGVGIGPTPGAIQPDGIEVKLLALGGNVMPAGTLAKEADALSEAAYITAAIAEVAIADAANARRYLPDRGPKTKKAWLEYAKIMRDGAGQFAMAVKSKNAQEVKTAATKLNNNCVNCHNVFKPKKTGG